MTLSDFGSSEGILKVFRNVARRYALIVVVHALFAFALMRQFTDTLVDDAAITFAYVETIAWTGEFSLRPGELPLEAVSNLLWCLILVPCEWLGFDLRLSVIVLSFVFSCFVARFLTDDFTASQESTGLHWPGWIAPGLVSIVLLSGLHWTLWLMGGLEGPLVGALWLLIVLMSTGQRKAYQHIWPLFFCIVGVFLTRPDGMVLPFVVLGITSCVDLLQAPGTLRKTIFHRYALLAASVAGAFLAVSAFRTLIWGFPLPNSFLAKSPNAHGGSQWYNLDGAGWGYVKSFYLEYPLACGALLLGLLPLFSRSTARDSVVLAGAVAAGHVLSVYAGGDWMSEWRLLTYIWPVLILALLRGLVALGRVTSRWVSARIAAGMLPAGLVLLVGSAVAGLYVRVGDAGSTIRLPLSEIEQRGDMWAHAASELGVLWPHVADPDAGGTTWRRDIRFTDLGKLADYVIPRLHPHPHIGLRHYVFGLRDPDFIHLHGAWEGAYQLPAHWEFRNLYVPLAPQLLGEYAAHGRNVVQADLRTLDSFLSPYGISSGEETRPSGSDTVLPMVGFHDTRNGVVRIAIASVRAADRAEVMPCDVGPGASPERREAVPMSRVTPRSSARSAISFTVWSIAAEADDCLVVSTGADSPGTRISVAELPTTFEQVAEEYITSIQRRPELLFARGTGPFEPMVVLTVCGTDADCQNDLRAQSTARRLVVDAVVESGRQSISGENQTLHVAATNALLSAARRAVGHPPVNRMPATWRSSRAGCERADGGESDVTSTWFQQTSICFNRVGWTRDLVASLKRGTNACALNSLALERACSDDEVASGFGSVSECIAVARAARGDLSGMISAAIRTSENAENDSLASILSRANGFVCVSETSLAERLTGALSMEAPVVVDPQGMAGRSLPSVAQVHQDSPRCVGLAPQECLLQVLAMEPHEVATVVAGCVPEANAPVPNDATPGMFAPFVLSSDRALAAGGIEWATCAGRSFYVESVLISARQR